MDPHAVEGANLTDYFYYDDHHPFDLTGHRHALGAGRVLFSCLLLASGSCPFTLEGCRRVWCAHECTRVHG